MLEKGALNWLFIQLLQNIAQCYEIAMLSSMCKTVLNTVNAPYLTHHFIPKGAPFLCEALLLESRSSISPQTVAVFPPK